MNWVSLNFGWLYVLFVAFLCFFSFFGLVYRNMEILSSVTKIANQNTVILAGILCCFVEEQGLD